MQDLMDLGGLNLPRILQHLITRPLHHQAISWGMNPYLCEGFLIMEFDGQIFRREISVPVDAKPCSKCGRGGDGSLTERYSAEIEKQVKLIVRDVRHAARLKLAAALREMTE